MKRIIFLISLISLIGVESHAQTDSSFTLQQCIDYALNNNNDVRNAKMDVEISQARVGEVRAAGLPQLNGTAQLADNPQLRRLFLNNDPSNPSLFSSAFPPGSSPGVYGIPQLFQLRSTIDGSIGATQLIFSGSYLVGLRAAKTYVELSTKSITQTKVQTVENVTKAYYLALINTERIKLLDANIARLDSLLRQTRAMNQQGFVEKIDVDRIEVTYNNIVTEREKFKNLIDLSLLVLKFQMGYDVNKDIQINGNVSELNVLGSDMLSASAVNYNNRPDYQLLLSQKRLEGYNLKNIHAGYMPTLSAFGNLGFYGANTGVSQVLSNRVYQYSMWGINLSVPIFDGFTKMYRSQQSKLNIKKIDNNINNIENAITMQTKQSEISIKNNVKTAESQKKNMELAQYVAKITKIKYEQGVGSNLETVDAERSYRESQTNYYNALYDLMVSKIDYMKATGTLYKE